MVGPWVEVELANEELHHRWREGWSGRSFLFPGLVVDSLRVLCQWSCNWGGGFLELRFQLFWHFKQRNLGSSLRKGDDRNLLPRSWVLSLHKILT